MAKLKNNKTLFCIIILLTAAIVAYFIFNSEKKATEKVSAPAWVNSSSERHAISDSVLQSNPQVVDPSKKQQIEPKKTPAPKKVVEEKNTKQPKTKYNFITEIFLENAANYVANSYQPKLSVPFNNKQPFTIASFKNVNTHFGLNLNGLFPNAASLVEARNGVWRKILNIQTLDKYFQDYSEEFLDLIEDRGITLEKEFFVKGKKTTRSLTTKERAEMFSITANELRESESLLLAVSESPETFQALSGYMKAERRVEKSNLVFQKALAESSTTGSTAAKIKASRAGKVLKEAITVREKIKTGIVQKIRATAALDNVEDEDIFYTAQWFFRRVKNDQDRIKSIKTGSKILGQFADKMDARSKAILSNT